MVGPLASLVRWQAARGHDVTALAWYLVRWHRWSVGIVGRLPEVMTSHAWYLVRWHRWQAARGHDVTRTLSMVGPLASLVRWQAARGHDVALGTWSVGIVVPLASLAGCQIGHDVTIEVTLVGLGGYIFRVGTIPYKL